MASFNYPLYQFTANNFDGATALVTILRIVRDNKSIVKTFNRDWEPGGITPATGGTWNNMKSSSTKYIRMKKTQMSGGDSTVYFNHSVYKVNVMQFDKGGVLLANTEYTASPATTASDSNPATAYIGIYISRVDGADMSINELQSTELFVRSNNVPNIDVTTLLPLDDCITIERGENNDDNPYNSTIQPVSVTLNVYNTGLDIEELMFADDCDFTITALIQKGTTFLETSLRLFLVSDGIQVKDSGVSYPVQLKFVSISEIWKGKKLSDMAFPSLIFTGAVDSGTPYSPINYIRKALYGFLNLTLNIPVYFSTPYRCKVNTTQNPFTHNSLFSDRDTTDDDLRIANGLNYSEIKDKSVYWLIENMCKALGVTMFEYRQFLVLINYKELIKNNGIAYVRFLQINSDISTNLTTTAVTLDLNRNPTTFLNESVYWMAKKPVGEVDVVYNKVTQGNNVILNGGFDYRQAQVVGTQFPIAYWTFDSGTANVFPSDPINNEQTGYSAQVQTYSADRWLSIGEVPVDTNLLYKTATLGFIWNPQTGYTVDSNGIIANDQMKVRVSFKGFDLSKNFVQMFLNEYGYWQPSNTPQSDQINFTASYASNDRFILDFTGTTAYLGQEIVIQYTMDDSAPGASTFRYTVPASTTLNSFIDNLIVAAAGIVYFTITKLSSTQIRIDYMYYLNGGNTVFMTYSGSAPTSTDAISLEYSSIKLNDIVSVQFQSKGGSVGIKLPDCGVLDIDAPAGTGHLKVELYCKANTSCRFDDVYFNVDDEKEQYTVKIPDTSNTSESYSLDISSSFSGFDLSSFGGNYSERDKSMLWTGNKTLTQLYAEDILSFRCSPKKIFSGDVLGTVEWGLITIMGVKYIPLSTSYNFKNHTTSLVAIEADYFDIQPTVEHKKAGG